MSKTAYPSSAELGAFLYSSGLITAPASAQQSQMFFDEAINAAVTEWERETGWVPFLSSGSTTRYYDPPGPETGPVGIYVGLNNIGGGRKLFLNAGLRSNPTVYVGRITSLLTVGGTVSGTVTAGVFTGTFTSDLGAGTFTGTGSCTITGTGSATLTFTITGTGNSAHTITGTTDGNPTGTCTGTASVAGSTISNGTLLHQNVEYFLRPQNAASYDRPWTYLDFTYYQYGNPGSISVTGVFGFGSTVPDDAWYAILKKAVMHLVPSLEIVITGGQSQIKLGNDIFTFNPQLYQRQTAMWQQQVEVVCGRYKRKVFA